MVNGPWTWSLPGGSLDGAERFISRDTTLTSDIQWYARRRATIREAVEAGDPDRGPSSTCFSLLLPELRHEDQVSPAVEARACLPRGLADALDD